MVEKMNFGNKNEGEMRFNKKGKKLICGIELSIYLISIFAFAFILGGGELVSATGAVNSASVTASGNVTGGNISTGGLITATGNINTSAGVSATGNVSGAFILGNITFATGYNASKIFNGTSWLNVVSSDPAVHGHTGDNNPFFYDTVY